MAALHSSTLKADWESVTPLPEPNGGFFAGCVDGKIVIGGGTNWKDDAKRWLDTVHVFDPATGKWNPGPALPHSLAYAASSSDGTRLYVAGGADGTRARKEIYALDASLKVTKLGELSEPVAFAGGSLHKGHLYIMGGSPDPDDWSKVTADLRGVDVLTGKASILTPLTVLKHGCGITAMVPAGGRFFTFTGAWLDPATKVVANMKEAFAYDIATKSWRAITPFHKPVRGLNAVALDDRRIYLAGGYGTDEEGFLDEAFIYDTETDRYTPAKPMPFKALTCLVKCGGHVYALGGEDKKKHRSDQCWRIRVEELLGK
jgi:N-acetylneuraminic acid mutarotase